MQPAHMTQREHRPSLRPPRFPGGSWRLFRVLARGHPQVLSGCFIAFSSSLVLPVRPRRSESWRCLHLPSVRSTECLSPAGFQQIWEMCHASPSTRLLFLPGFSPLSATCTTASRSDITYTVFRRDVSVTFPTAPPPPPRSLRGQPRRRPGSVLCAAGPAATGRLARGTRLGPQSRPPAEPTSRARQHHSGWDW